MCQDASFKQFFYVLALNDSHHRSLFSSPCSGFSGCFFFGTKQNVIVIRFKRKWAIRSCHLRWFLRSNAFYSSSAEHTKFFLLAHQCNFQTFMLPMEWAATHINPIKWYKHNLQSWREWGGCARTHQSSCRLRAGLGDEMSKCEIVTAAATNIRAK